MFYREIIIVVILQATLSTLSSKLNSTNSIACGEHFPKVKNHRQKRIIGGKSVDFGQYPWQVLVKASNFFGMFERMKCGGALISRSHVLTAAHCRPRKHESLVAVLGLVDLRYPNNKRPEVIKVNKIIINSYFDVKSVSNDIAILELNRPVSFKPHIYPINLPSSLPENVDVDFSGQCAVVSGWGRMSKNVETSKILQHVSIPVINNELCQKYFNKVDGSFTIRPFHLCAGYQNGGFDACTGDSGSPLSVLDVTGKWTVIAIVSHGIGCGKANHPGIYTRVSYYLSWIMKVLKS